MGRSTHSTQPARAPRPYAATWKHEAPAAIEAEPDSLLRLAVGYYREGVNSGSPYYRFLSFWNVLEAAFEVHHQTAKGKPTPEAVERDTFIRQTAPAHADNRAREAAVTGDVADYFREDSRNALAHVIRPGKREVRPDDPAERVRLSDDASWLHRIARAAIEQRWPDGVRIVRRPE